MVRADIREEVGPVDQGGVLEGMAGTWYLVPPTWYLGLVPGGAERLLLVPSPLCSL